MRIPSGVTDQYIYFVAVDSTDLKTRETGLSSFTVYRSRNGGAATAFTTPTIAELSAANMPGVYSLLLDEDMTIGSGNDSEEMVFHITQASMAPVTRVIELYREKITQGETIIAASGVAQANVKQVADSATAGTNLGKSLRVIGRGTVTTGGSTTSIPTSAFAPAGAVADQFKNRVVIFDDDTTTTALRGQAAVISASSNAATPTFTVSTMTTAPASGDTFSVV